ncbi:MAG: ribonuclease H-like domain-containing protein [Actinomycetota bacterium]|nr:ribonuclease H-like domain-containing protein [Actinomycetota bacterium]
MIEHTFSILKGVGPGLERRLWRKGILNWADFIAAEVSFISPERKKIFDARLSEATGRLASGDMRYFARALRRGEHWRLFDLLAVRKLAPLCLDIETNGWDIASGGYPTVVGVYDGLEYRAYVRGENLTRQALEEEFAGCDYLITFFGSGFDMPFLKDSMGVVFEGLHFDLAFGARRLGMKGGLKKLEDQMGVFRDDCVRGMDGYDAVKLWRRAGQGDEEARRLLILYNKYDTVNLMEMAGTLYGMLRKRTGIGEFI